MPHVSRVRSASRPAQLGQQRFFGQDALSFGHSAFLQHAHLSHLQSAFLASAVHPQDSHLQAAFFASCAGHCATATETIIAAATAHNMTIVFIVFLPFFICATASVQSEAL